MMATSSPNNAAPGEGDARRGGSNEYTQAMFLSRIRKIMHTPVNPSFTI